MSSVCPSVCNVGGSWPHTGCVKSFRSTLERLGFFSFWSTDITKSCAWSKFSWEFENYCHKVACSRFCSHLKEFFMHRSESSLSSSDVQYALLWPESPTKFCPATGLLLGLSIPGQSVPNNSLALFSSDRDPESSVDRRNVFRFRSFLIMRRTEECDTPVSRAISLGLLLIPGWPSWLQTSSSTIWMFSWVHAERGRPLH